MKRIGELDFSHGFGGCANVADDRIYLCFNDSSSDFKKCRVASAPLGHFSEIMESIEKHRGTRIAASDCKLSFFYSFKFSLR